jgi:hypothetical protein
MLRAGEREFKNRGLTGGDSQKRDLGIMEKASESHENEGMKITFRV